MNFINGLKNETNWKLTENGQPALNSTLDDLVDLFGTIGALRSRSENDIILSFQKAFAQDNLLAMKTLFYSRNIRGLGQGERRTFRIICKWLANVYPEVIRKNLHLVPSFGRWDDLYEFVGTPLERDAFGLIKQQFVEDIRNANAHKPISLLAKWLKSVNTSSSESRKLGILTAKYLQLNISDYRRMVAQLRKIIGIIESKMCAKEWSEISYSQVPSKAMTNYRKAFSKHDAERFVKYLDSLKKGETKINASTLYPYDLVAKVMPEGLYSWNGFIHDEVVEAQWKALPNYIEGENSVMIVADTSGSMSGKPLQIALSLAIYFAERNTGPYKDKFITFASKPSFVELKGSTLAEKLRCVPDICDNTNLEAVFDLVLKTAISNNLKNEDLPKSLVVISDMEFDTCVQSNSFSGRYYNSRGAESERWTFYDSMKAKFESHGYAIPNVVFWNVDARQNTFHAFSNYKGVQMASGSSASIFKSILKGSAATSYELMMEVLNDETFDCITI